jgi:hypothetical protein
MPGQVNTDMAENSRRVLGLPEVGQLSDAELMEQIPEEARAILIGMGLPAEGFSADDVRQAIPRIRDEFRGRGFTADEQVRADPEAPFDYERYPEMYGPLIARAQARESGTPEPQQGASLAGP